jgi:hypothetical protein
MQFFGNIAIDGASEVMTVTLKDVDDRAGTMRANCDGGPITGNLATPVPRRAHFRQQRPNQPPGDSSTAVIVRADIAGLFQSIEPLPLDHDLQAHLSCRRRPVGDIGLCHLLTTVIDYAP